MIIWKNVVVHVIQVSCACSTCDMSDLIHKPAPKFGNYIPSTECERLLILQEDFNCTRFESNYFQ